PGARPQVLVVRQARQQDRKVGRLSDGLVIIWIFDCSEHAERRTCETRTALGWQYLAGRPAFAGMTVDDIVAASDAWNVASGPGRTAESSCVREGQQIGRGRRTG